MNTTEREPRMSAKHSETHSRTPWAIGGRNANDNTIAIFEGRISNPAKRIALALVTPQPFYHDTQEANAAYIVRCVNSHEQLVSALAAAQSALVALSTPDEPGDMPEPLLEQISHALEIARGETQ